MGSRCDSVVLGETKVPQKSCVIERLNQEGEQGDGVTRRGRTEVKR